MHIYEYHIQRFHNIKPCSGNLYNMFVILITICFLTSKRCVLILKMIFIKIINLGGKIMDQDHNCEKYDNRETKMSDFFFLKKEDYFGEFYKIGEPNVQLIILFLCNFP